MSGVMQETATSRRPVSGLFVAQAVSKSAATAIVQYAREPESNGLTPPLPWEALAVGSASRRRSPKTLADSARTGYTFCMEKAAMNEAELQLARDAQNALATPEAVAEWYGRPENSLSAATPEQIKAWREAGGSMIGNASSFTSVVGSLF